MTVAPRSFTAVASDGAVRRHGHALAAAFLVLAAPSVAMAQLSPPPPRGMAPAPVGPRSLTPATAAPAAGEARPFALAAGERTGWGLAVGQPGTIDVSVRATGSVVVSVTRPNGTSIEQSGRGQVQVKVPVTAQDTATGQIWVIGVRPGGGPPAPAAKVSTQPMRLDAPIVAQGTVTISHPPGDAVRAQAEGQQRAQRMKPLTASQQSAIVEGETRAANAQAEANQAERQRMILDQLRATLASGRPLQKASGTPNAGAPTTSAVQGGAPRLLDTRALPPATAPAGSRAGPVGSQGAPATAAMPAAISSLSVTRGVPNDAVLISGSGFGSQAGTVRIEVAPGRTLPAPVVVWSEAAILAKVPDATGIAVSHRGQLSVERTGSAAATTVFEFVPATETRVLAPQPGLFSVGGPGAVSTNICHPACAYGVDIGNLFFGHKGEDVFFNNVTLKNGWRVAQVGLGHVRGTSLAIGIWTENNADAHMIETRVGTTSPYLKVGWWHDAFSSVAYWPKIVIEGPKGVPHF